MNYDVSKKVLMSKYNGELFLPGSAWKSKGDKKECKSFVCRLQKQQKQSQFTQKRGMVKGISIVFCWYHEVQTTKTKYHMQREFRNFYKIIFQCWWK